LVARPRMCPPGAAMTGRNSRVPEWAKFAALLIVFYAVSLWCFLHTWATP
jgi:hypothetical protein